MAQPLLQAYVRGGRADETGYYMDGVNVTKMTDGGTAEQCGGGASGIQAEIDLHGLRTDDAREALAGFIREAARQGLRCLRVVHGKGLGVQDQPNGVPVQIAAVEDAVRNRHRDSALDGAREPLAAEHWTLRGASNNLAREYVIM